MKFEREDTHWFNSLALLFLCRVLVVARARCSHFSGVLKTIGIAGWLNLSAEQLPWVVNVGMRRSAA